MGWDGIDGIEDKIIHLLLYISKPYFSMEYMEKRKKRKREREGERDNVSSGGGDVWNCLY